MVDFAVLTNQIVQLKEIEKRDKYLDLGRKQKNKLWNMKVMVKPIVTGALATVTKGLEQRLEYLEIGGQHFEVDQNTKKSPDD